MRRNSIRTADEILADKNKQFIRMNSEVNLRVNNNPRQNPVFQTKMKNDDLTFEEPDESYFEKRRKQKELENAYIEMKTKQAVPVKTPNHQPPVKLPVIQTQPKPQPPLQPQAPLQLKQPQAIERNLITQNIPFKPTPYIPPTSIPTGMCIINNNNFHMLPAFTLIKLLINNELKGYYIYYYKSELNRVFWWLGSHKPGDEGTFEKIKVYWDTLNYVYAMGVSLQSIIEHSDVAFRDPSIIRPFPVATPIPAPPPESPEDNILLEKLVEDLESRGVSFKKITKTAKKVRVKTAKASVKAIPEISNVNIPTQPRKVLIDEEVLKKILNIESFLKSKYGNL